MARLLGVAVGNALPEVKDQADFVTEAEEGLGVEALIERLLDGELLPAHRPI